MESFTPQVCHLSCARGHVGNSNLILQHSFSPDPNLVRTFLMTYRSFCQPNELLDLLVERYKIPSPNGFEEKKDPISMKAMKTFKITYQTPIQLRYVPSCTCTYSFTNSLKNTSLWLSSCMYNVQHRLSNCTYRSTLV